MGLFYGHRCRVCRTKRPNHLMTPSWGGLRGWVCRDCLRDQNLAKARDRDAARSERRAIRRARRNL